MDWLLGLFDVLGRFKEFFLYMSYSIIVLLSWGI
jgi:hypothetical protein